MRLKRIAGPLYLAGILLAIILPQPCLGQQNVEQKYDDVSTKELKDVVELMEDPQKKLLEIFKDAQEITLKDIFIDADQIGFESQITQHLFRGVDLQLSYSYLDPDHLTAYNPRNQIKIFIINQFL